ncbi:anti-sigma factor [Neobacillus sp. PS3-34]|uniref:anti-sigma factor n=1 Tax=Neobacillus sp. PS3-34 TaxID=3070678 RepID=UPI0027DEEE13|nr:anti-sigma factor [Neobacillus sp. PS3-34]WML50253.1 anti-sigma factor [Neobacillus sp. PS3-34]
MNCSEQIIEFMHDYLDEEIAPENEVILRQHLQSCKECEILFNEMKKTETLVQGISRMEAPSDFTQNVLSRLPKEKKKVGFQRWLRHHPVLAAASVFIILMMGSLLSTWNQDHEFSVSKQNNLVVKNDTVIVPKGKVVKGDVIVKNGKLKIEGEVQGDVTVINGEKYLASAGHVTGEIKEVNAVFDWLWFYIKKTAKDIINVVEPDNNK